MRCRKRITNSELGQLILLGESGYCLRLETHCTECEILRFLMNLLRSQNYHRKKPDSSCKCECSKNGRWYALTVCVWKIDERSESRV
ncbi:hypothetical protein IHE45_19G077300 [Dioscorea alata]|uniref:Uncharacterized protein n=1 Tax=Dioscorea alata TaxID=55571 RepID=A0ACB7TZD5_DIOAL|nr:hypothetical protein IHE45_19G077300 [Dioscorea alata]